ncbi:Cof-like hydrolase [Ethanoligenens harbinense YUAN-3]|uniref:Cof-like hydrolase n=2 Tax=Ethanoligenens harbinense TaxID=253239 RepID=E6U315_ETHHY|nr:Cof-like hydrolase [Ethanoligenens harbinense YUAN-3]AVQ95508.1 Cof-type HAD-IIB family hydrolase [Ethanoligenens harbinense YUAN-3]AYF38172.1 Cof-type HAD-IIB family hydrolase [Ethanoligenens harbinense]AYF40917.1 Cof-type HAD-IIB family hydrolase [Ethanoligenens harbinense]QCN91749.1 Cof-type HAD-IIB family hydrolase [Ethanoligenens harbinense]
MYVMGCRMIFSDIDGTILNTRHQLTEATRQAVAKALGKGVRIVLVSARMPQGMEPIRKELALPDILICYGGALIMEDGKAVFSRFLPLSETRKIAETAGRIGIHISLYRQDRWIIGQPDEWAGQESDITSLTPDICPFPDIFQQWEDARTGPNKILFMAKPDRITALKQALEHEVHTDLTFCRSKPTYLEVIPPESSKRLAVSFLCKRYGIPREDILAIGDGENDLDMIEFAGIGVAMGNAPASVKNTADFVTRTNDEDGWAFAVQNDL